MLQKNNFDFQMTSYPIFDEAYRNTLNKNILNYYYESEIGFETAPLFRKILNDRLTLIMPKYNMMYQAQASLLADGIYSNVNLHSSSLFIIFLFNGLNIKSLISLNIVLIPPKL